jgi:hypothetical protein
VNTPIERLSASKQEAELQDKTEGKQAGREWADEKAGHAELRRWILLCQPEGCH